MFFEKVCMFFKKYICFLKKYVCFLKKYIFFEKAYIFFVRLLLVHRRHVPKCGWVGLNFYLTVRFIKHHASLTLILGKPGPTSPNLLLFSEFGWYCGKQVCFFDSLLP